MAVSVCLVGFVDGLELEGGCGLVVGLCEGGPCPTDRLAGNDLGHILPLVELGLVFDQLVEDGDLDFSTWFGPFCIAALLFVDLLGWESCRVCPVLVELWVLGWVSAG